MILHRYNLGWHRLTLNVLHTLPCGKVLELYSYFWLDPTHVVDYNAIQYRSCCRAFRVAVERVERGTSERKHHQIALLQASLVQKGPALTRLCIEWLT